MTIENRQELVFRVITDSSELFQMAGSWEALFCSIPSATPFCAPKWILSWFDTFWKEEWQLFALAGFQGDDLRVFVPTYIQPSQGFGKLTCVFPLGQGEDEIAEICSEYLAILAAPGYEETTRQPILDWLQQLDVDAFHWHGVRSEEFTAGLMQDIDAVRTSFDRRYLIDRDDWSIDKLGRSTKKRLQRVHSRLRKTNNTFEWIVGSDQEALWPTLAEHHQRRWRSKGLPGAFRASRFLNFHKKYLAETNYENSCMSCLKIDDEPIAINYYFMNQDTLYFYQSGWDLDFANLSPGFALHIWSIQHTGRRYYDFMIGGSTSTYKKSFGCSDTEIINFEIIFSPIRYFIGKTYNKIFRIT